MKVKGTVLTSVAGFVKDNFPNREDEWLDGLPSKSKDIFCLGNHGSQLV
jgi:hypothetical protein